ARGRCGSLDLHRRGLAPPTPCQSPGKSGRNVTLRGKIAHPLVIARPPAPALPPSAGARRSGLSQHAGNRTCFHKKTCEIFWQAVNDTIHVRPYFVAKSQTKMVRSMKFARIPPVSWQGMTAKTADKYDKADPAPDAPAGWRSRRRCETARGVAAPAPPAPQSPPGQPAARAASG